MHLKEFEEHDIPLKEFTEPDEQVDLLVSCGLAG